MRVALFFSVPLTLFFLSWGIASLVEPLGVPIDSAAYVTGTAILTGVIGTVWGLWFGLHYQYHLPKEWRTR